MDKLVQSLPAPNNNVSQNSPTTISQLTKNQVLNGYNQCEQQFKNGELQGFKTDYRAYDKWDLARRNEGKQSCDYMVYLSTNERELVFADLDSDGLLEALIPAGVCGVAACDGSALFVFKNIGGIVYVADEVVISAGVNRGSVHIISTNKNTVVVSSSEYGSPKTETYKFVNGKLIKQ